MARIGTSVLSGRKQTVFFAPTNKSLAEIVQIDTPSNARTAVRKLMTRFNKAGHAGKLQVLRATNLAAIRARIMSENIKVSLPQRKEARIVNTIYTRAVAKMSKKLQEK